MSGEIDYSAIEEEAYREVEGEAPADLDTLELKEETFDEEPVETEKVDTEEEVDVDETKDDIQETDESAESVEDDVPDSSEGEEEEADEAEEELEETTEYIPKPTDEVDYEALYLEEKQKREELQGKVDSGDAKSLYEQVEAQILDEASDKLKDKYEFYPEDLEAAVRQELRQMKRSAKEEGATEQPTQEASKVDAEAKQWREGVRKEIPEWFPVTESDEFQAWAQTAKAQRHIKAVCDDLGEFSVEGSKQLLGIYKAYSKVSAPKAKPKATPRVKSQQKRIVAKPSDNAKSVAQIEQEMWDSL